MDRQNRIQSMCFFEEACHWGYQRLSFLLIKVIQLSYLFILSCLALPSFISSHLISSSLLISSHLTVFVYPFKSINGISELLGNGKLLANMDYHLQWNHTSFHLNTSFKVFENQYGIWKNAGKNLCFALYILDTVLAFKSLMVCICLLQNEGKRKVN